MPEPSFASHTAEVAEILEQLFHLRSRRPLGLPVDLARLKARLDKSHPGGAARRASDYDLLHRVGLILAHQREPITMGELARALDIPLSSATRIVDWLVRNEFAGRTSDLDDRRIVRVYLTAAGQELYRAINAFVQQRVTTWLQRFTEEERAMLVPLLRKLVRVLEEEG